MGSRKRLFVLGSIGGLALLLVGGAILASFTLSLGSQSMGAAVGGAQDANAFRENVRNGYVPQPTDITYEGLYHDYRFEFDRDEPCRQRFCPTYSRAVSPDPLSNGTDQYLAVGLASGIDESEFQRPNVTMVVVVDTSGSMDSGFGQYYYDNGTEADGDRSKMEAARAAVRTLADQLGPGDRLAIVDYDDDAYTALEMTEGDELTDAELNQTLRSLSADGGTDLSAGMEQARELTSEYQNPGEGQATRIVYVTDAMPNQGETTTEGLTSNLETDAQQGVHTTFVGVGVDFNSELTNDIADVRGANYYTVQSPPAFEDRMSDGFQYMVTPLAYNLSMNVSAPGYEVERAYGTPSNRDTGALVDVATLFPSRSSENGSEGSVILLELNRTSPDPGPIYLNATYETPDGTVEETSDEVTFTHTGEHYDSTGVRRAVVLTRYATLLRNWAAYERSLDSDREFEPPEGVEYRTLGQWEQQSVPLTVSDPYDHRIRAFREYFTAERDALGGNMSQDIAILDRLIESANNSSSSPANESSSTPPSETPAPTASQTPTNRTAT